MEEKERYKKLKQAEEGASSSTITIHMYDNVVDHIDGLPHGWLYEIVQHK